MKALVVMKPFSIPAGMLIVNYFDDALTSSVNVSSPDDDERDIYEWIAYIVANSSGYISDIDLGINEFTAVVVSDITANPVITFEHISIATFLGFQLSVGYEHDNQLSSGMNIFGSMWGLGRYIVDDADYDSENDIGTDGRIFLPHETEGGWTVDGRSYREKNRIHTTFWKLETTGLSIAQAKQAMKFMENIGSNVDLIMKPESYDVFDKLYFQVLAHKEYIKEDDVPGDYAIEFELSERYGEGFLTLNDDITFLTLNDDTTFLTRS